MSHLRALVTLFSWKSHPEWRHRVALLLIVGGGQVVIEADQAGNSTYSTAAAIQRTVAVNPGAQTLSFTLPISEAVYTSSLAPVTLGATATSGLTPTYTVQGPATINGSTLTFTGPGSIMITAAQPGSASWTAAAPITRTFTVDAVFDHATSTQGVPGSTQTLSIALPAATTLGSIQAVAVPSAAGTFTVQTGSAAGTCTAGMSYSAGAVCTVNVILTPHAPGLITGTLQLLDNNSVVQTTVPLVALRYR